MKIAMIIPYFGRLPECFKIWLKSCELNQDVDFFLFIDDCTEYDYPQNVYVNITTFENIQERIRNVLGFQINLKNPYKLCDYKPVYGEAFSDYLTGYDFWGFCDIDLIFGKIRNFITDEILLKYDRIYTRGHFSLFKNNDKVNSYYRTLEADRCQNYKNVFSTDKSCAFDEWANKNNGGLSLIMKRNNKSMYDEADMADLNMAYSNFKINRHEDIRVNMFEFSKEGLYGIGKSTKIPFIYVHFQKRKMYCMNINLDEKVYILPPAYMLNNPKENYFDCKLAMIVHKLKYFYFRFNNMIKKIKNIIEN